MIIKGLKPPIRTQQASSDAWVDDDQTTIPRHDIPDHLIASDTKHRLPLPFAATVMSMDRLPSDMKDLNSIANVPPSNDSKSIKADHKLSNGVITIGVNNHGAELVSLHSKETNLEYIWQGDPAFWGKHAPVLFPIVGRLKDDTYTYQGKTYHMNQHGFARDMKFALVYMRKNEIAFELSYNDETLKRYPFKFKLLTRYKLMDEMLSVIHEVSNLDNNLMLFSIGGHPGFRCPLVHWNELFEEYSIEFDRSETLERFFLDGDTGVISPQGKPFLQNARRLPLTRDMFDEGAIVLKDLVSDRIKLVNKRTGYGVALHMPKFPYFGIWAKPGADFVCLEPWQGIADSTTSNQRLEDKEGIIKLPGKGSHITRYTITPF